MLRNEIKVAKSVIITCNKKIEEEQENLQKLKINYPNEFALWKMTEKITYTKWIELNLMEKEK